MKALVVDIVFFALVYFLFWRRKRNKMKSKGVGPFANGKHPNALSTAFAYGVFVACMFASMFIPYIVLPEAGGLNYFAPFFAIFIMFASYHVSAHIGAVPFLENKSGISSSDK